MLTAIHGGGASACTITQLERNTVYDFFLIPFYKSIEGKPSNLIQTATLEDGKDVQYDDYYYDYGNNTKILSYAYSAKCSTDKYGSSFTQYNSCLSEMATATG